MVGLILGSTAAGTCLGNQSHSGWHDIRVTTPYKIMGACDNLWHQYYTSTGGNPLNRGQRRQMKRKLCELGRKGQDNAKSGPVYLQL